MSPPQGMTCPGCETTAVMKIGGEAWCLNALCHVLKWEPGKTLEENARDIKTIDLSFLEDES